jgi:hypothetical protein
MIVKVLGGIDILAGLLFWLFGIMGFGSREFLLLLGLILLIKGIIFMISMNIISLLDILVGAIIMMSASDSGVVMPKIVVIIVSLFLLQKGLFSLVGD